MTIDYTVTLDKALSRVINLLSSDTDARILDVGGAMKPLAYASHILDYLPYEQRCWYGTIPECSPIQRFKKETWLERDLCETPWPYEDKSFDIVWCTQTVEDIRDPIAVIKEISRVGKCGFLSTVHRSFESKLGDQDYAGYIHHRWLVEPYSFAELRFLFKYPLVHIRSDEYRPNSIESQFIECWWEGVITAHEYHLTSLQAIEQEFKSYAKRHQ